MSTKKIAETINLRINIGNYQHIEISKYAEKEISYDSVEEMKEQEDLLTSELLDNIKRNIDRIPNHLGKVAPTVIEKFEEKVISTLPSWMQGNEEPNLAKKSNISSEAESFENEKSLQEKNSSMHKDLDGLLGEDDGDEFLEVKKPEVKKPEVNSAVVDEDELF